MQHGLDAGTRMNMLDVYVGFDSREAEAFQICQQSLVRRSSIPLHVQPVVREQMEALGLFHRRWESGDHPGVVIDSLDRRPFSTEFAFTRFLVPFIHPPTRQWALFCDCDFLFLSDVAELLSLADPKYAVMCVKHEYAPEERQKMEGQPQSHYPRKNWSSLVLWNVQHEGTKRLSLTDINAMPGRWLHAFSWLKDEEIGGLPLAWNWLEGWSPDAVLPHAVHFTRGGPWLREWKDVNYAHLWRGEKQLRELS